MTTHFHLNWELGDYGELEACIEDAGDLRADYPLTT